MSIQEKIKRTEKSIIMCTSMILIGIFMLIIVNYIGKSMYGILKDYLFIPNGCIIFVIGLNIISVIALYICRKKYIEETKEQMMQCEFRKSNELM